LSELDYYNEIEPYSAGWIRNLQQAGHIPVGCVDERSIVDVRAKDLQGVRQAHFFAGIGGWPLALKLAGWPEDEQVWTGSCPCQPFSVAGGRKGTQDKRHLWPEFRRLIEECNPAVIFGEQVASKDGRVWLDGVHADLENLGYEVGGADLCAAGVGAPHVRQRLFWMGHSKSAGQLRKVKLENCSLGADRRRPTNTRAASAGAAFWSSYEGLRCADGAIRRAEPGTFPLAYGVPGRVGKLRAYGNAIVPQVAAEFIKAYLEAGR